MLTYQGCAMIREQIGRTRRARLPITAIGQYIRLSFRRQRQADYFPFADMVGVAIVAPALALAGAGVYFVQHYGDAVPCPTARAIGHTAKSRNSQTAGMRPYAANRRGIRVENTAFTANDTGDGC